MKFLLDENVPRSIKIYLLSEKGFDTTTIQDLKKRSVSNGEVAKLALKRKAIIITFDRDFTVLNEDLKRKSKIIYIKIHPRDPVVAKRLLNQYLDRCIENLKTSAIIEITKEGIQVLD